MGAVQSSCQDKRLLYWNENKDSIIKNAEFITRDFLNQHCDVGENEVTDNIKLLTFSLGIFMQKHMSSIDFEVFSYYYRTRSRMIELMNRTHQGILGVYVQYTKIAIPLAIEPNYPELICIRGVRLRTLPF